MLRVRFRNALPLGDLLNVRVVERDETYGGVRFAISLRFGNGRDQTFLARTHAWVGLEAVAAFARELEVVERTRRGSATMTSMSPGEFVFTVAIVDSAGHPVVRGQTGRRILVRDDWVWCCVPFEIPFDPGLLPGLAEEFGRFVAGGDGST